MPVPFKLITRRDILAGAAGMVAGVSMPALVGASAVDVRVTVIGCGVAGTRCARLIKRGLGDRAAVRVVAPDIDAYAPPFTRTQQFLGGAPEQISVREVLGRDGIEAFSGKVVAIDPAAANVMFDPGTGASHVIQGDIIVVAPGVVEEAPNFPGLSEHHRLLPSMWSSLGPTADPAWLGSVTSGEQIVIVAPPQPYRCPPAIYERVCLLGGSLRHRGIDARIVIIDHKDQYPMQVLFEAAYTDYLGGMVEWIPQEFHGGIVAVDLDAGTVETAFDAVRADWLHVVGAQRAPAFVSDAGLADAEGYGRIDAATMRTTDHSSVYILGDAANAREMAKSADSALVHAEIAAHDIVGRVSGDRTPWPGVIEDRCWTCVADNDAIVLYGRYEVEDGLFHAVERAVSDVDDPAEVRAGNVEQAIAWPAATRETVFGETS